jgi:hypothetical protein
VNWTDLTLISIGCVTSAYLCSACSRYPTGPTAIPRPRMNDLSAYLVLYLSAYPTAVPSCHQIQKPPAGRRARRLRSRPRMNDPSAYRVPHLSAHPTAIPYYKRIQEPPAGRRARRPLCRTRINDPPAYRVPCPGDKPRRGRDRQRTR